MAEIEPEKAPRLELSWHFDSDQFKRNVSSNAIGDENPISDGALNSRKLHNKLPKDKQTVIVLN